MRILTFSWEYPPIVEDRHGVAVHRMREPDFPKDDLDAFIAWLDHMNEDMLASGAEARRRPSTSSIRTTGWSPRRRDRSPGGGGCPGW